MRVADLDQFSSPLRKLVRFFQTSRDKWKSKSRKWKAQAKRLSNQTRAVEKSRDNWKERASAAERRVAELELQIEQLKFCRGVATRG